jgi:trans-AT polyketide synthase/acyltransferase/oxidoreductase domain-containing protein
MKTAFVFAGQGSQYPKMARAALESDARFRANLLQVDDVMRSLRLASPVQAISEDASANGHPLERLPCSHIAIFAVQYALAKTIEEAGICADAFLGYSLGEIVALTLGGVLELEEAARLLGEQAREIERTVPNSSLLAVFDGQTRSAERLAAKYRLERSAVNWPGHTVFAVAEADIANVQRALTDLGVLNLKLAVSFAFHSSHIDPAREGVLESAARAPFREPTRPVYSLVSQGWVKRVEAEHVWSVIRHPIEFPSAVTNLSEAGFGRVFDLSPNASMRMMVKKNAGNAAPMEALSALDPFRGGALTI